MTPQELKTIRKKLTLTQRELGFWLNPDAINGGQIVRRWESGKRTIPGIAETALLMFDKGKKPVHIKRKRAKNK